MEVTRSNFAEVFDEIRQRLRSSCLVSFDAEFTALPSPDAVRPQLFHDGSERYSRMCSAVSAALMSQVGLTLFVYDRDASLYRAHTYTFHLCPQRVGDINQKFGFEASTLQFLCRHGFDFNKFIYYGIPYLSRSEAAHIRSLHQNGELTDTLFRALEIIQEQELQENCSKVSRWLSSAETSDQPAVYLPASSAVLRYLTHAEVRSRFPAVLTADSLGASDQVVVYRNKDVAGARRTSEEQLFDRLMNDLLGFSRVVELISESQRPLAGHNIYLDLLLLHNQFLGPVPSSYSQYKRNVHEFAPHVYDTKHIAALMSRKLSFDDVWKSTALQDLYEYWIGDKCKRLRRSNVLVLPSREFTEKQTYHEAGWDSYCAGYLLLRLGSWAASEAGAAGGAGPAQVFAALTPFRNQANIMRSAVLYMNLEGEDPPSHRPRLMHVEALKTKKIDIAKVATLLAGFGTVDVRPYGARAALVATATHHTAEKILRGFRDADYRVSVYSVYRHSGTARAFLWSGALVTGALLVLLHRKVRS